MAKSEFTDELKRKIAKIADQMGLNAFCKKYETVTRDDIERVIASSIKSDTTSGSSSETIINDNILVFTNEEIAMIKEVLNTYDFDKAIYLLTKLGHSYHTIRGWIQKLKDSTNNAALSSGKSTKKINISSAQSDSGDENISIVIEPAHDLMPNEIHRPLYILELMELVGFRKKDMVYFVDFLGNNSNMLFRSGTEYVVRNLVVSTEYIKESIKKELLENLDNHYDLLKKAYRWCLLRPCGTLSSEELFIDLFYKALEMRHNKILVQEYLDVVIKGEDPLYQSDDGFADKAFILHPREASYRCFIDNIISRAIYRYKNYFDLTYNTEKKRKLNKTVSEYIPDIQNRIIKNSIQNITGNLICEGKTASMIDLVFPENGSNAWTHNVSICGRGGCGKTYQMINIIDEVLSDLRDTSSKKDNKYKDIIPFYLALNDVNRVKGNCVIQFISESYEIKASTFKTILEGHRENVVIFCDGMNEVTNSNIRAAIANSILSLIAKYHTRIVISSRIDHGYLFNHSGISNGQKFIKAEVSDLTPTQIKRYFKANGLYDNYNKLPLSTQELLKTAQGLSMYVALRQNKTKSGFINFGNLLETYVKQILCVNGFDNRTLQKVAYHMAKEGIFKLHHIKLKKLLDSDSLSEIISNENITKLFYMINGGFYQYSHQTFRDFYAALFIKDKIEHLSQSEPDEIQDLIGTNFTANGANDSEDILNICSDLFISDTSRSDDTIIQAIDVLRSNWKNEYSYCLSLLIKVYAYCNNNSIADLDLSYFDLTNISLSNYKLFDLNKNSGCKLTGATICEDTFLINGLQNACSTICKYDEGGKTIIAAFSSTNVMTYDIVKNTWKCYRNYKNRGWINACCVTQINGKTVVLLCTDQGHLTVFDPETKKIDLLIENKGDPKNGLQDIVATYDNGAPAIFYSDSCGNVYLFNVDHGEVIRKSEENEIERVRLAYEDKSIEIFDKFLTFGKHLKMTSRMTVSTNGQYLYLSYGNSIYRYELSKGNDKRFTIFKEYDKSTVVQDITYTSRGLLINKLNEISFVSDRGNEYRSFKVDNEERLEYFTKFSLTADPEKALIGVSARYSDFSEIENFYRVYFKYSARRVAGEKVARGRHIKTTYTGVPFVSAQTGKQLIATVADDRAVQIISPTEEDVDTLYHKGSYDGVRNIAFINENEILLAQYDGSVSIWFFDFDHWECVNIYNVHSDWVWNAKHTISPATADKIEQWRDQWVSTSNAHIFSCSYDGTIEKTNVMTGEKEPDYTIRDLSHRPFIDLVVFENGNSVMGITENDIYFKRVSRKIDIENIRKEKDWERYILRSIENVDDKIFIGLKATKKDGTEECFIYSWSDAKINLEMACEKTCSLIADIRIIDVQSNKFMIIYGYTGKSRHSQYFAIYMLVGNEWVYKGSTCPDEDNSQNYSTSIELIDVNDAQHYGAINDIAIWDKNRNSRSYRAEISFELYAVYKNRYYRAYDVIISNGQTIIKEKNQNEFAKLTISPHPSQPLCLEICNDTIVVGQLNGLVTTNTLTDVTREPIDFLTHANLNAGCGIDLTKVKYKSPEEEKAFKQHFKGYFDFGDY